MAFEYETKDVKAGTNISSVLAKSEPDSVTSLSQDMFDWRDRSLLPRTLMGGTYAMRLAGNDFLPQHVLESQYAYARRLSRSTLLNAFRKTSSFLAGQVFQSDIIFEDNIDPAFEEWALKIDVKGNALDVFAKRVFQSGLAEGVRAILVDVPEEASSATTVQDEKDMGIRPYFKEIKGTDILGGIVDENGYLIQVRIQESVTRRVGKYGSKTSKRVRVLEPGKWELHEIGDDGGVESVVEGTFSIPYIPLVLFIPGEEWTILTGESPIMDLADLNAKHWRSSSDQDNILSVARVPVLFGKNIEIAQMPVGVATMITSTDDDADLKYVEIQGGAISAGQKDLDEIEAAMALYGLQQLIPRTGNMTATEKAITSAESNSSLGTWATEYESVLCECFKIAGAFMGKEFPDFGLTVNKEFDFGIADPQELAQILESYNCNIISAQATFSEFRRRGIFEEHLSWEDMEADIEQEKRDSIDMAQLAGSSFGGPQGSQQGPQDGTGPGSEEPGYQGRS